MYEIFSCLSPLQQVPCRKVCQLRNALLTSVGAKCRVEVDITNLRYHNGTTGYHKLATILHERVTGSTRVLILSEGNSVRQLPKIHHLHTVKTTLKAMNLRVRFIVLSGARVDSHDRLDSWYSVDCDRVHHSKWRDVCDTLILHSVAVEIPFATTTWITVTKEVLDVQAVDVGVENVLEKWCPEVSASELQELERNLHLLWGRCPNVDLWMRVLLTTYQRADEGFPPYGLGSVFPAGNLGVPIVASLRKLTVWALAGHSRIAACALESRIAAMDFGPEMRCVLGVCLFLTSIWFLLVIMLLL